MTYKCFYYLSDLNSTFHPLAPCSVYILIHIFHIFFGSSGLTYCLYKKKKKSIPKFLRIKYKAILVSDNIYYYIIYLELNQFIS